MNSFLKLLTLILVLNILVSCGEDPAPALKEKVYQNKEYGFEMYIPAEFIKLPEEQTPNGVIISYLDILYKKDDFTPNFNLIVEKKEYIDMDILIFAKGYIDKTKKTLKDYELIAEEKINILDKPTKYHIFKATKDNKKYKFIQTFFEVSNNNVIIFTAILDPDTTAVDDDRYLNIVRSIRSI